MAPLIQLFYRVTPTSFADENGNVLEPMKGKQWGGGGKIRTAGGTAV